MLPKEFDVINKTVKQLFYNVDTVCLTAYRTIYGGFEVDVEVLHQNIEGDYVHIFPDQTVVWDYQHDGIVDIHNLRRV